VIRALALGACLALAFGCSSAPPEEPAADGVEAEDGAAPADEATDETPDDEAEPALDADAAEPLRTTTIEVYFPSLVGDGLVGEYREIFDTATPGDRAKQIVNDLISGPTSDEAARAVAPGTRLRQVYVLDDGVAYIDFSQELTQGFGGGSERELETVYAIVNSIALNVREIQRVAILVGGRPIETMNGHLDLRRPLKPNPRLILGSVTL